jgi:hypothetical protein
MDTTLAHQTNMIDKYLMGELTHEERSGFEDHMFDCPECAARVNVDFAMIANLKQVLREEPEQVAQSRDVPAVKKDGGGWREWFRPVTLVPAFAALGLAVLVGYQNFISIPGMLRPQVLDTTPIVAATRGTNTETITVPRGAALFGTNFEVFTSTPYSGYVCEFIAPGGPIVASVDCGKRSTTEFTLSLLLPAGKFAPGVYTMILRPASDKLAEISRYSFAVKTEDK